MKGTIRYRGPADLVASLGGLGDASIAPGTWGSLLAIATLFPIRESGFPYLVILALLGACAVWSAEVVCRNMHRPDPGRVIIDEAFGMGLVLLAPLPAGWLGAGVAFLLFRLFDILKPPPVNRLERLPGGWGIVADDAGAAGYAVIVLVIIHALPSHGGV